VKTTARVPDGIPSIAMRNPLRIGPRATLQILPLLGPQFSLEAAPGALATYHRCISSCMQQASSRKTALEARPRKVGLWGRDCPGRRSRQNVHHSRLCENSVATKLHGPQSRKMASFDPSAAHWNSEKIVARSDQMAESKSPRKLAAKVKEPEPRRQDVAGQAAAAEKNRERETRLRIIQVLCRLGIPDNQWPDFVRAFYANPQQRTEYHQFMTPPPFQAPAFDRLNQSPKDWWKVADRAWELHRNRFLQDCDDWVREGVDEEIVEATPTRGRRTKRPAHVGGRNRGNNTPINRRYLWAAKYLVKVLVKEIAGAHAEVSTVGRVAREIVRLAGWPTK